MSCQTDSRTIEQNMISTRITEVQNVSENEGTLQNAYGMNYGSVYDNRRVKKRQIVFDESHPNMANSKKTNNNNNSSNNNNNNNNNNNSLDNDENYHFLMSLLPYLREVPHNIKMKIRHRLQNVFIDELDTVLPSHIRYATTNHYGTPVTASNGGLQEPVVRRPPPYNHKHYVATPSQKLPTATPTSFGGEVQPNFAPPKVQNGPPQFHTANYNNLNWNNNKNNNNNALAEVAYNMPVAGNQMPWTY